MFRFLLRSMWAIRLYVDRFLNKFRHPQPCIIDPNDINEGNLNCDQYCADPSFKGAVANQAFINGETRYYCCPNGYTPEAVRNPITRETSHIICRKS